MFVTVTIKAEAESKGELIDTFGAQVRTLRQHMDALREEGLFGPPEQTELRYLVVGGGWRENPAQQKENVPSGE